MKKYLVEFAFAENFICVVEWHTIDGLEEVVEDNAENAAKFAACTDGLENALFRVFELTENQFGRLEAAGEPKYFNF